MGNYKKGFTLLELVIVSIIIGWLVTLGFAQYSTAQERSRRAEARAILGVLRSLQLNFFLENDAYTTLPNLMPNVPEGSGGTCANTAYYFAYSCNSTTGRCTASRCASGGKAPDAPDTYQIWLEPNGTWGGEL